MRFLLILLLMQASCVNGLFAPLLGIRMRSWFGACKKEHAQLSLAMWVEIMLKRGRMYPESSYKSNYDAIDYINANNHEVGIVTWNHVYNDEYHIISHIILTQPSSDSHTLEIHGIVENPDNVIYNKSIIPMVDSLREKMVETNLAVNLDPLEDWNYGIYFAALTMKLRNK
jgi:hypothetical protein